MSDILADAFDWLRDEQHAHCSRTVTYQRGAHSVSLTAVLGRTPFRTQGGAGRSQMIWSDRDFMFDAAALILNGSAITPAAGDKVTDGTTTYVLANINGEPCYREIDDGRQLRCHTKRV